mgnify:CR=1 FL=1|jgi:hypothetical protein
MSMKNTEKDILSIDIREDYLKKIRKRDPELHLYIGTNCPQVAFATI